MLSSISPVGEASRRQRWWITAGAYTVGSLAGGALIGGALGAVGQAAGIPGTGGAAIAVLGAAALAGTAVDRGPLRLPTWHRQVDERWLGAFRGWVYGAGFGAQLGLAVVTIVPASVTYVALLGALLTGSWWRGGLVGAAFGLVRAVPLLLAARVRTAAALRRALAVLAAMERPVARGTLGAQASLGVVAVVVAVAPVLGGVA